MIIRKEGLLYNSSKLSCFLNDGVSKDFSDVLFFGELDLKSDGDFKPLIEKVKAHALAEGKTRIIGPINESTYFDYRLKLNFFTESNYIGEPTNSSATVTRFAESGFEILKMYHSHEFKLLNSWMCRWLGCIGSLARIMVWIKGYRVKNLRASDLLENYQSIHSIIHEIFGSNFLYSSISDKDFLRLVEEKYIPSIDEYTSVLLFSPEGECVGFNLCLKDKDNENRALFKAHGVKRNHRLKGLTSLSLMSKSWIRLALKYRTCLACLTISGGRVDDHFHKIAFKRYDYALYELKL